MDTRLAAEFPACAQALHAARVTARKAVTGFPKWAARDATAPLADDELAVMKCCATRSDGEARGTNLLIELGAWAPRRFG